MINNNKNNIDSTINNNLDSTIETIRNNYGAYKKNDRPCLAICRVVMRW